MGDRQYQKEGNEQILYHFASGIKRVMLKVPTGGGKTHMFAELIKRCHDKQSHSAMIVRGRELVQQASDRLAREGVDHGVMMAGHPLYNPRAKTQVCSIDTLVSRGTFPRAEFVVFDEAHLCTSKGFLECAKHYKDSYILGVSATPYSHKSLRHIAEVVVEPTSVQKLINQGFLVDAEYYAPSTPDLQGVGVSRATRDYKQDDLAKAMNKSFLVGDIVSHWKTLAQDKPTLVFATSIAHSKQIAQAFRDQGINFVHCDADTSLKDRQIAKDALKSGQLQGIVNVGIFCVGSDIPCLGCIVMARPTKSYNLHIQQLGRGTRPYDGKNRFIVLDHAGNLSRHGFITSDKEVDLDGIKQEERAAGVRVCDECFTCYPNTQPSCPSCNHKNTPKAGTKAEVEQVDGQLRRVKTESEVIDPVAKRIGELKETQKKKGYKRGWVFYQIAGEFGIDVAQKHMPQRTIPKWLQAKIDKGAISEQLKSARETKK